MLEYFTQDILVQERYWSTTQLFLLEIEPIGIQLQGTSTVHEWEEKDASSESLLTGGLNMRARLACHSHSTAYIQDFALY